MCMRGFSYISVLIFIMLVGTGVISLSKCWQTVGKREKEKELLFRGDQFRHAIESYYNSAPDGGGKYPEKLSFLLKDNRYPVLKRHIRKLYKDPVSKNGEWELIYNSTDKIIGVHSKSGDKPLKTGNFNLEYKKFEKANRYSDWKFVYIP